MELSQAFNRRKFFLRLVSSFVLVSVKSASGSASATTHKQKEERVKDMNPFRNHSYFDILFENLRTFDITTDSF